MSRTGVGLFFESGKDVGEGLLLRGMLNLNGVEIDSLQPVEENNRVRSPSFNSTIGRSGVDIPVCQFWRSMAVATYPRPPDLRFAEPLLAVGGHALALVLRALALVQCEQELCAGYEL